MDFLDGNLLTYLVKNRGSNHHGTEGKDQFGRCLSNEIPLDKKRFAQVNQRISGLVCEHEQESDGSIFRDLAARNILLTRDKKRKLMAKLSDFGLSQEADEGTFKLRENSRVSTRWTAPEALKRKVWWTKSDVWSFGVLLWEIYTEGKEPFQGIELKEVSCPKYYCHFTC